MQYKAKDRAVIRFDREPQPWPEVWTWLWVVLVFLTLIVLPKEFMKFPNGRIVEDPNFLYFAVLPGSFLLIAQLIARSLTSRHYRAP